MFLLLPEYLVSILPKSRYLDGLLFCALLGMVLKLQCFKLSSLVDTIHIGDRPRTTANRQCNG